MIALVNGFSRHVHSVDTQTGIARSPRVIFYELTRACAQGSSDPNELSSALSKELVNQIAEFPDPPTLVLTGGHPLKRADVYELIEFAFDSGLEVAVELPATPLVSNDAIDRLRDCGMARLVVNLEGATAFVHDATCNQLGSYARTLHIIEVAHSLGIPVEVSTTLTKHNFAQTEAMAELLSARGIALWSVFFLVPVDRAEAADRLSGEQCEQAFEFLWRSTRRTRFTMRTLEAPHYQRFVLRQIAQTQNGSNRKTNGHHALLMPAGFSEGKGTMFVSHAGLIHASRFLPLLCGMFPFNHVVEVYQNSCILRDLRGPNALRGKCRACEYRHICGGSRARAYAVTGDLFAQEPDCTYVPLSLR